MGWGLGLGPGADIRGTNVLHSAMTGGAGGLCNLKPTARSNTNMPPW